MTLGLRLGMLILSVGALMCGTLEVLLPPAPGVAVMISLAPGVLPALAVMEATKLVVSVIRRATSLATAPKPLLVAVSLANATTAAKWVTTRPTVLTHV